MARRCGSYESAVISAFVLAVLMAAGAPSLRAENGARAEFVG